MPATRQESADGSEDLISTRTKCPASDVFPMGNIVRESHHSRSTWGFGSATNRIAPVSGQALGIASEQLLRDPAHLAGAQFNALTSTSMDRAMLPV